MDLKSDPQQKKPPLAEYTYTGIRTVLRLVRPSYAGRVEDWIRSLISRREFAKNALASLSLSACGSNLRGATRQSGSKSLVPDTPSLAPNYWCTWAAQNYISGDGSNHLDEKLLEGANGAALARDAMNEELVFGETGWSSFFAGVHNDLYLLFDDGWATGGTATFQLDTRKFPSFSGPPETRLARLNDAVQRKGWRGAALWCRDTPGGEQDRPLVRWSKAANLRYWKIDGGDLNFHIDQLRDDIGANLTVEHIHGEPPLNGDWRKDGRFEEQNFDSSRVRILRKTDVYRTYDTNCILSIPTTLDRAAQLLHAVQQHPEVRGLLNVEDEVYIAAVLGCTMGVMRHPLTGLRPDGDPDLFFNGPRQTKKRMDEVARALRWQRIAAPYAAGMGFFRMDEEILTDDWQYRPGETWYSESVGQLARQGAPARMSRNLPLPEVAIGRESNGEKPFVYAGRFPNGSVAVGMHERIHVHGGWTAPRAEVRVEVSDAPGPFGLFGYFEAVTLSLEESAKGRRVMAEDLVGGTTVDITSSVEIRGRDLRIPGTLIDRIGRSAAAPGNLSNPGMILKLI